MDTITIPANFNNLHDLGELVNNYSLMSKLQNALNNYQETYFKSFIKTYDEVLEYIPKSKYNKYKIRFENEYLFNYRSYWNDEIEDDGKIDITWGKLNAKLNKKYHYWSRRDNEYISYCKINDPEFKKFIYKNNKFIINDIKKEIIILPTYKEILPVDHYLKVLDNKYTVDVKKQQLTVEVPFESHETQAIGGHWINGRGGYLSGNYTHVPYIRYGYYKYIFDTNINNFIDYKYEIDEERDWEPIKY